jgi:hypothetical protein
MEAELLRGMIADRDVRMEKIKRKCEEQATRNIQLCQQLEDISEQASKQSSLIVSEKNILMQQYKLVIDKLEQMQRDFKQQGASLKTYSKDTSAASKAGNGDASYVMRMQAQLCKAMHSLGITDHQMELAMKHTELIVKYQKETLIKCREERTTTELELMNQLIGKDNERRSIEESFSTKLDAIAKERDALERQMEESGHDLNDDDDDDNEKAKNKDEDGEDEEDDDEEKEVKEELMQLLSERRAEIERLEVLQEEQEEIIAELEEQVADGVGSGTITQRKTQSLNDDNSAIRPPRSTRTNISDEHDDQGGDVPTEPQLDGTDDIVQDTPEGDDMIDEPLDDVDVEKIPNDNAVLADDDDDPTQLDEEEQEEVQTNPEGVSIVS